MSIALPLYVCIHVWLCTALVTVWIIGSIHRGDQAERQQAIADVVEDERRQRAHWLHDDVCAQLRLVSLNELGAHGLVDPSLREMHLFARRCRPFLQRFIDSALVGKAG